MHIHRRHTARDFKRLLIIIAVGIAGGLLTMKIMQSFNTLAGGPGMTGTEQAKQKYIDQYKSKYGDQWKEKMKEDYKAYSGR